LLELPLSAGVFGNRRDESRSGGVFRRQPENHPHIYPPPRELPESHQRVSIMEKRLRYNWVKQDLLANKKANTKVGWVQVY